MTDLQRINLDLNATTPLAPQAWEAMRPYFLEHTGNPASSHHLGRKARQGLEQAREQIAQLLDAHPDEVIFTSGATEANNLAIFGLCGPEPGTLLVSPIEHPCVTEPIERLVGLGFSCQRLAVDRQGVAFAEIGEVPADLRLATLMLANHETGAVQPVEQLARAIVAKAPLHCDAAAAVGKLPVSFHGLGVASLTLSAHKFHGPKGVGALLLRKGTKLRPLFLGGHQQQGKRPGTEPVPLAVGMAVALELAVGKLTSNRARTQELRARFLSHLQSTCAPIHVNGPDQGGLPGTLNISFPGCQADILLMKLDLAGVACSTGSACSSGSLLPSPVLRAMQVAPDVLQSALRFSFDADTSAEAVIAAGSCIALVVNNLRRR